MHIVLVEPEIPANTGNIARTCSVTGASLHLVKPLGFSTDDRYLKRAGLDYWHQLDLHYHEDFSALRRQYPDGRFWYLSTKAAKSYHQVEYQEDDFLVFGKETAGLPKALLAQNPEYCLRIPMLESVRSLNLSNSAAVVLYEALRQLEFPQMK
ncbi:tRNA (uridine(34)/cytosine(34)/5-carboxymethylaminomethyluridine(34)-2'-O)-methyltransferase TrmL [Desulforamulus ruminis]|uniref:Putative tRNA (cytidine(34)-2'-O)-methyltransferase n=1 Tax=Desulforamulus ruminis (strain ATCC 23193 / DSM 2154 / NCIMB 8452 / DL) TaxID=696281 RepID=F6DPN1_DESRL|nr:tRNA (uridine(34)/cytosine(34)/5-carboxymethylaminomethyluridine(34)-2'-O)-methyltransferase TrmL [Desulforamulus ruminis]AEG59608.1 RNA methyltransferase, TrmH family, group 2 [Desulforamulus ruminis DSM 2154]